MEAFEFESKFIHLIRKQRLLQWENYTLSKKNDLNEVNKEIYYHLTNFNNSKIFTHRKKELFERIYIKYFIENDPDVAKLRNKLDDRDNYNLNLDKNNDLEYKIKLAERMKEDVIELMHLRNFKAKKIGFSSYPDLIFYTEELDKEATMREVENYLSNNIERANILIQKYGLTWDKWFEKLSSIGTIKNNNYRYYINCLINKLGFESIKNKIKFKIKDQPITGVAFGISIPKDIRILLKPIKSLMNCKVLFHECGHGINYASNNQKGIYTIYTTFFDEVIAILFETIGVNICLLNKEREITEELKILEAIRCSISFLFEMELWERPEAAEELFRKYQLKLSMKPERKEMWALDTFRYIDPVYIHNYVLGEIYSQRIVKKLKDNFNDDYKKWGETIKRKFLSEGMKKSFIDKYHDFIN